MVNVTLIAETRFNGTSVKARVEAETMGEAMDELDFLLERSDDEGCDTPSLDGEENFNA